MPAPENGHGASPDELVERLFESVLGMIDVHMVYVGDRLGLYRALDEGAATPAEVASATSTDERYVREWLEQQAVSGLLRVEDAGAGASERRYSIADAHREVFLDRDSPAFMAPFARMMVGITRPLPAVLEAFRKGGGVPYSQYDADFCDGQGEMNRISFVNELGSDWLPAIPEVDERLRAEDPPARVADVACGTGWSTVAIARSYPNARVEGYDLDPYSIERAKEVAAGEGLADRLSFEVRDAADAPQGEYDLVTIFEAVHDLSRPVEVLGAVRSMLAPGGAALIADERVAESFTAPGDEVERVMYGFSVLHCLPVGRADEPSAATGTAMRPDTLREYAAGAGFSGVEVLGIEHDFWRFYLLRR